MLIKCLFCVYQQLQARQGWVWSSGSRVLTSPLNSVTSSHCQIGPSFRTLAMAHSLSSAWGQPYAHSLGSPAHLPASPSPTQQPSGQAGQLVCVPLLRDQLHWTYLLAWAAAVPSRPSSGIPVQRRKEGHSGSACSTGLLPRWSCCVTPSSRISGHGVFQAWQDTWLGARCPKDWGWSASQQSLSCDPGSPGISCGSRCFSSSEDG